MLFKGHILLLFISSSVSKSSIVHRLRSHVLVTDEKEGLLLIL